jgi:uncharacterized protein (DUF1810 family)
VDHYNLQRFVDAQHSCYRQVQTELGARLRDCTRLVTAVNGRTIEDIFGYPDHLKFHWSMTLFAQAAADNQIFMTALSRYFKAEVDNQTMQLLPAAILAAPNDHWMAK